MGNKKCNDDNHGEYNMISHTAQHVEHQSDPQLTRDSHIFPFVYGVSMLIIL